MCSGTDNQLDDSWAPFAYDAAYSIAHALHILIERIGRSSIVGSELLNVMIRNVRPIHVDIPMPHGWNYCVLIRPLD